MILQVKIGETRKTRAEESSFITRLYSELSAIYPSPPHQDGSTLEFSDPSHQLFTLELFFLANDHWYVAQMQHIDVLIEHVVP